MKLEINMVVKDAREAADFYNDLFGAEILSKTDLDKSLNETRMVVGGTEIRVLNENEEIGLVAPSEDVPSSMWVNLFVDDINKQCKVAEDFGCVIISPVTQFPESNAINAVFRDKYGHIWVINQKMD
ncbi:MAG: VOC family protein [Vallitalea sp.]|jgi:uncharacterized glyoxalase superfamily protein PhnB|nr:VOC family protein [Vallitalea sp.]